MKPSVKTLRKGRTQPLPQLILTATSFIFSAIAALVVISALAAYAGSPVSGAGAPVIPWNKDAKKTMRAFGSEEELKSYFRQLAEAAKKEMAKRRAEAPPAPAMANQKASTDASKASGFAMAKEEAE